MTTGKGSLTLKDFPFAFSLAILIFPSILTSDEKSTIVFGVIILGSMLGSLLTIVNPLAIIMNYIYLWTCKKKILLELRDTKFGKKVIEKNFYYALKSPSISYETDKIIGIFYVFIIISLALFRLEDLDFISAMNTNEFQTMIIKSVAWFGFFGVLASIVFNISGWKSVSHLQRIYTVTISFLGRDFINLSTDGNKIYRTYCNAQPDVVKAFLEAIKKHDSKKKITFEKFAKDFDHSVFSNVYPQKTGNAYDPKKMIYRWWDSFLIYSRFSKKYDINFEEINVWLNNSTYFNATNLDPMLNQLQSSIDSRDWQNAVLNSTRMVEHYDLVFQSKGM